MMRVTQFPAHFSPNYDQNRTNHDKSDIDGRPLSTIIESQPFVRSAGQKGLKGFKGGGG